jgi:signal transduction histidine kinase
MTGGTKGRPRQQKLRQEESADFKGLAAPTSPKIGGGNQIPFIRTLAHDLRNPISGILAASQCLLEDATLFLDGPHVTLLRAIESSSDLLLHLIEDMLEVARAGAGELRLHLRPTDVTKLVEKSVQIHRGRAEARNIRLRVTRDEAVPRVEIDTPKLRWALNALLANTIRSSERGGEIEIHVGTQRKNVVIAVRPAGGGSAARTDSRNGLAKRGRHRANALTVSTARLIVEGHGGTIRVNQKGTAFAYTLTLPRYEAGLSQAASSTG